MVVLIETLYAKGRLKDAGRQNNEHMSRKTGNAQSHATNFRDIFLSSSCVRSLTATLCNVEQLILI